MSSPSYTTKWRCKECGQLYGHNPSECDICGHTVFRPLPADGAEESSQGGEYTTELGADVTELVDQINEPDKQQVATSESEPTDRGPASEDTDSKSGDATKNDGVLSKVLTWFN